MTDFREAIADEINGYKVGGGYYSTFVASDEAREMADAILATPEMQALRSLIKEMSQELVKYQNEYSYFGEEVTPMQVIMSAAYDSKASVSVVEWLLSND